MIWTCWLPTYLPATPLPLPSVHRGQRKCALAVCIACVGWGGERGCVCVYIFVNTDTYRQDQEVRGHQRLPWGPLHPANVPRYDFNDFKCTICLCVILFNLTYHMVCYHSGSCISCEIWCKALHDIHKCALRIHQNSCISCKIWPKALHDIHTLSFSEFLKHIWECTTHHF